MVLYLFFVDSVVVGTHYFNAQAVWKNIKKSLLSDDSLFGMGDICGLSESGNMFFESGINVRKK